MRYQFLHKDYFKLQRTVNELKALSSILVKDYGYTPQHIDQILKEIYDAQNPQIVERRTK